LRYKKNTVAEGRWGGRRKDHTLAVGRKSTGEFNVGSRIREGLKPLLEKKNEKFMMRYQHPMKSKKLESRGRAYSTEGYFCAGGSTVFRRMVSFGFPQETGN